MREAVVGPQRRGAGPRFVVEEIRHGLDGWVAVRAHVKVAAHIHVADFAEQAGADYFGLDDMIAKIQGGWLDFDMAIATPQVMVPRSGCGSPCSGRSNVN